MQETERLWQIRARMKSEGRTLVGRRARKPSARVGCGRLSPRSARNPISASQVPEQLSISTKEQPL